MSAREQQTIKAAQKGGNVSPLRILPGSSTCPPSTPENTLKNNSSDTSTIAASKTGHGQCDSNYSPVVREGTSTLTAGASNNTGTSLGAHETIFPLKAKPLHSVDAKPPGIQRSKVNPSSSKRVNDKIKKLSQKSKSYPLAVPHRGDDILSFGKHSASKSHRNDHPLSVEQPFLLGQNSESARKPPSSSRKRHTSDKSKKAEGKDLIRIFHTALADLGQALNTFISKDDKAKATSSKMNKPDTRGKHSPSEKSKPRGQEGEVTSETLMGSSPVPANSDTRPTLAPFCPPAELLVSRPSSEKTITKQSGNGATCNDSDKDVAVTPEAGRGHSSKVSPSTSSPDRPGSSKARTLVLSREKFHPSEILHGAKDSCIIKPTVLESPDRYTNDRQGTHPKLHRSHSSKTHSWQKEKTSKHRLHRENSSRSLEDEGFKRGSSTGKIIQHHRHRVKLTSEAHWPAWKSDSGRLVGPSQSAPSWNGSGQIPVTARNLSSSSTANKSLFKTNPSSVSPSGRRSSLCNKVPSPDLGSTPLRVSGSDSGSSSQTHRQLNFRKRRSSSHRSRHPSFSHLLRIASQNAGKDPDAFGDDPGMSRKRHHSEGQLSSHKSPEGWGRPQSSFLGRFQKLGSMSEPEHSSSQPASFGRDSKESDRRREDRIALSDTDTRTKFHDSLSAGDSALSDDTSEWLKSSSQGVQGHSSKSPCSPITSSSVPSSPSASVKKRLNLKEVRVVLSGRSLKKHLIESDITCGTPLKGESPKAESDASKDRSAGSGDVKKKSDDSVGDANVGRGEGTASFDEDSEDSDDSFLMDKPSALIEETTALLETPMPVTPSKHGAATTSFQPSPMSPGPSHQPVEQKPDLHYTLDKILHIKTVQKRKYGDVGAIRSKLMDSVSTGGFAKLAEKAASEEPEDEEIDPAEYVRVVKRFDTKIEKIPEVPPGEEIFHKEQVCQLFTPTQCLHDFQKMTRANGVEDLLGGASTEEIEELIKSGFLECYYHGSQAPATSMHWMFKLMSVHPSCLESSMLYDSLWSQLNQAPLWLDELDFPWMPTVKDIITVLLNYGGDIAGLISVSDCDISYSLDCLRELDVSAQEEARLKDVYCQEPDFFTTLLENQLGPLLKILTQAIITHLAMKNCSGYRTEELQCLLIIMLRIALDKHIIGHPVIVDIANAVSAIIEGFEDVVWYQQVERLCVLFPLITGHHHNMVYLLQSCIPLHLPRGRYLYRMLGYAGLQKLVFPEKGWRDMTGPEVPEIKVSSLIPILHCCKPSQKTDYYQLNSTILLLDCSIGNEKLKNTEKRDLEKVIRRLREMVGDIREDTLSMSRSQVKSLIVRTAARLSFMTQSMITDKEGIFGFLGSDLNDSMDVEVNPELHINSQTDPVSDGDDDSNDEMEGDEDEQHFAGQPKSCAAV